MAVAGRAESAVDLRALHSRGCGWSASGAWGASPTSGPPPLRAEQLPVIPPRDTTAGSPSPHHHIVKHSTRAKWSHPRRVAALRSTGSATLGHGRRPRPRAREGGGRPLSRTRSAPASCHQCTDLARLGRRPQAVAPPPLSVPGQGRVRQGASPLTTPAHDAALNAGLPTTSLQ